MKTAPDGRQVHHWVGKDRKADIDALTSAIAESIEIYNQDGALVRLDENGKLVGVNLASLRELIDKSICAARVVMNNGVKAVWTNQNRLSQLLEGNNDIPWRIATTIDASPGNTKSPKSSSLPMVSFTPFGTGIGFFPTRDI